MTRGVPYTKSPEQIQSELIDRQINELKNLQNYIMPGYNSSYYNTDLDKDKKTLPVSVKFALITLIILALSFILEDICFYILVFAICSVPIAFLSYIATLFFIDLARVNYLYKLMSALADLLMLVFNLAVKIILLAPETVTAVMIKALIKP